MRLTIFWPPLHVQPTQHSLSFHPLRKSPIPQSSASVSDQATPQAHRALPAAPGRTHPPAPPSRPRQSLQQPFAIRTHPATRSRDKRRKASSAVACSAGTVLRGSSGGGTRRHPAQRRARRRRCGSPHSVGSAARAAGAAAGRGPGAERMLRARRRATG